MLDNEGHGHVRPRSDERDAESGTGGAKRPNVEALAERAIGAEEPTYFSCAVIALATYIAALEAERDALRADAERWRMLLEHGAPMGLIDWGILGLRNQDTAGLTAAIDAAIAAIAAKEPKS